MDTEKTSKVQHELEALIRRDKYIVPIFVVIWGGFMIAVLYMIYHRL